MIHRNLFSLPPVLVLALAFTGCDDPVTVRPTTTITGEVRLFDELANQLPDSDLVTVKVLGANQSVIAEAVTEPDGSFEFELVEEGPFTLIFTRDGFGTRWTYEVAGGSEAVRADLFALSTAEVRALEAEAYSCGSINCLRLTMDVDHFVLEGPTRRLFRIFLSTDAGVSWAGYQRTDLLIATSDQPGFESDGTSATFELASLTGILDYFPSGATVHMVIHGATENLSNGYSDPVLGLEVFTDLSPVSARAVVVVP